MRILLGIFIVILPSFVSHPAPEKDKANYKVLWVQEYDVEGGGIGLTINLDKRPANVNDYKRIICKIVKEVNLEKYREFKIRKDRLEDYESFSLVFYFGLDKWVPTIGPVTREEAIEDQEHALGNYGYNPDFPGILTIYHFERKGPHPQYAIDYHVFCRDPEFQ